MCCYRYVYPVFRERVVENPAWGIDECLFLIIAPWAIVSYFGMGLIISLPTVGSSLVLLSNNINYQVLHVQMGRHQKNKPFPSIFAGFGRVLINWILASIIRCVCSNYFVFMLPSVTSRSAE